MSEEKSEGGGSVFANPSALLALVTIAGGLWLVSQNLTSDRPVTPAAGSNVFIGDQKSEARLWEDPFKQVAVDSHKELTEDDGSVDGGFSALIEQIRRRSDQGNVAEATETAHVAKGKGILLLPVMLSGGQYSEDLESRIRSRFAIVSALGRSGYAPDDAEHIGALRIPWLTQQQLDDAKRSSLKKGGTVTQLWEEASECEPCHRLRLLGFEISGKPVQMDVRYEWYRPRAFAAGAAFKETWSDVLVLWLDETYFEDDPLLRLPLFLERLTNANGTLSDATVPHVALIGPRRSSTLRNMLPDWQSGEPPLSPQSSLTPLAKKVLKHVDIFSATASAMDEVLVKDLTVPNTPRASVKKFFEKGLFSSFHNFAATDAQMAVEVIGELALRQADLRDKKNHVVLISEWDTFYARMLSLTYGAELALAQQEATQVPAALNRAQFVNLFVSAPPSPDMMPKNFHSFVYLRGLDGQTVGGNGGAGETHADKSRADKSRPTSIEELRHWAPDVNKAEGQAQFDYLGRLGDQLEDLQKSLRSRKDGQIKAIGIVGSDVYDTLLILQALRHRFPAALFFTTDLDVRFFHPNEREWARNLIVASSYGLALHSDLQGTIAPFRDSLQTAQFAATLAALGNDEIAGIKEIPARRFEVGNRTAVDLSVKSGVLISASPQHEPPGTHWLHPMTNSELYGLQSPLDFSRLGWALLAIGLLLAGTSWWWDPLRRLTWEALVYPRSALDFSEEDLGGHDGIVTLMPWLKKQNSSFAHWLHGHERTDKLWRDYEKVDGALALINKEFIQEENELSPIPSDKPKEPKGSKRKQAELFSVREKILVELTATLIKQLNRFLRQESPGETPKLLRFIPSGAGRFMAWITSIMQSLPVVGRVVTHYQARRSLDAFLDRSVSLTEDAVEKKPSDVPAGLWRSLARVAEKMSQFCNILLGHSAPPMSVRTQPQPAKDVVARQAAQLAGVAARYSAKSLFRLRCRRLVCFWGSAVGCGLGALYLTLIIWRDTFHRAEGELFSLFSGTSAWPAEIIRLLILGLAVCFGFALSFEMREAFLGLSRTFRFPPPSKNADESTDRVCAQSIWYEYSEGSRFRWRWPYVTGAVALYILLLIAIMHASGAMMLNPLRGQAIQNLNNWLILAAFIGFLLLAFLTVDASYLCRRFIEKISATQTLYPEATRQYFSREKGGIDMDYLDEWIDLKLIADLTEKVGRLVYYPAVLVVLLVLARNSWWDSWTWPLPVIIIFFCNFLLALASVVILQCAAKEAKRKAEQSLTAKVKKLQAQSAPSVEQNNATQAEKLLEEIQQLKRGAFVPFWDNPVVGAVFLSSGGTTMLQVFIWFMGR